MADLVWVPRSPLGETAVAARPAKAGGDPGARMREVGGFSLVLVMARRGRWASVADAAARHFGVAPPQRPAAVPAGETSLIWSGPGQFYVLGPQAGAADPVAPLRGLFGATASLSDQSDGRALIRIGGRNARDMLAKVSSIDLDPSVFAVGAAAATSIDHTSVLLWRGPDEKGEAVFNLLVFASFAESLWRRLADSAFEFGLEAG